VEKDINSGGLVRQEIERTEQIGSCVRTWLLVTTNRYSVRAGLLARAKAVWKSVLSGATKSSETGFDSSPSLL